MGLGCKLKEGRGCFRGLVCIQKGLGLGELA